MVKKLRRKLLYLLLILNRTWIVLEFGFDWSSVNAIHVACIGLLSSCCGTISDSAILRILRLRRSAPDGAVFGPKETKPK